MKPQPIIEVKATAYARKRIADLRSCFDKNVNRQFFKAFIKKRALKIPGDLKVRVELARRGVEVEGEVVREIIGESLDRGEPLPKLLAEYNKEFLRSSKAVRRRRPGPRPYEYQLRDLEIYLLVRDIVNGFKLNPTRSSEKKPTRSSAQRPCACSIVSSALKQARRGVGMDEQAVVTIWKRFSRLAKRQSNVG